MTEKELKTSIKSPEGGYFFYGDEDYLKEHYTALIRKAVIVDESLADFNEILFDNDNFSPSAIEDALMSPPMMMDKKLIKIRLSSYDALPEKEKKQFLELVPTFTTYDDTVVVISVAAEGFDAGTKNKPSSAFKVMDKNLKTVDFPLSTEEKLVRWLYRHFSEDSLASDEASLRLMIKMCGRSMHRLRGEAEKVSARALSMGLGAINAELIMSTVTRTPEEEAFMLTNSVIAGNTEAALECLGRAIRRNEPPARLLASITKSFCDMAQIFYLAAEGLDRYEIAKLLGLHHYAVKLQMDACRGASPEILDRIVELCCEADLKTKTGVAGYIPLERLICTAGKLIRKR